MDYTKQPFSFKIRKAIRYTRLYGVRRTRVKAEAYYHMNRRYELLPPIGSREPKGRHVGLIGCGKFAFAQIAFYLKKNFGDVIYAAMDIDLNRAASLFEKYGLAYYTNDATEMIADKRIDTIFVASNHASHAEYGIDALRAGKTVHIEKPHVVTEDQLERLWAAMTKTNGRVSLGFNRPQSEIGMRIKECLGAEHGTSMQNWFVAGHEIPVDHWYFSPEEGGRILGNLCHWTDFVLQVVPSENRLPIRIVPTKAERSDCDIAVTYTFGDGSVAAITFSAKGHLFEGVKERFAAHRGNTLITMDDFRSLDVQVGKRRERVRHFYRDHGHERMIRNSYFLGRGLGEGASEAYVWETGQLFLKTKEALDTGSPRVITAKAPAGLETVSAK